jgi:hypothetical protein
MIQLVSPKNNSIVGGTKMRYSYSTLSYWDRRYIKSLLLWSYGVDVDIEGWPDDQNGDTIYIYPITIWGRTDALRFNLHALNKDNAAFEFHPLDDFGSPMLDSMFTTEVGNFEVSNPTLAFHINLPLAFSWVDPNTGVRTFSQGNRTIIATTEPDVDNNYDEARVVFHIDVRPPSQPVIEQVDQVVTDKTFNITGTVANVDGGSWIVEVES